MTLTTRTLTSSAAGLVAAGAVLALLAAGPAFAGGFAAAGGLMLVNLALWKVVVRRAIRAALGQGGGVGAVVLVSLKFLLLVLGLYLLVASFPALAVLLGSSVVVASVMGFAALGAVKDLEIREGC